MEASLAATGMLEVFAKTCPPHDAFGFSVNLDSEFREVLQHFRHLIATLATAHIDDDVRVGVLGEGLRDHSLATSESARNGSGASLDAGEESIKAPLAGEQRVVGRQLLRHWAGLTDRPDLAECVLLLCSVKLGFQNHIFDCVVARRRQVGDCAPRSWWHHHRVLDQVVLLNDAINIAASDMTSDPQLARLELPLLGDA